MPTPTDGYYIGVKKVPSVTQIISVGLGGYSKDALMQWAWKEGKEGRDYKQTRDTAASVGTAAHAMIEAHLNGVLFDPTPFLPEVVDAARPCFEAFARWRDQHHLVIHEQEVRLTSQTYQFGGTFDALGTLNGVPALLDWKSSSGLYGSYACQVAAYYMLVTENRPRERWPQTVAIVRVGKDATLNVAEISRKDLAKPWEVFLHAKAIYHARYDLDRLITPAPVGTEIVRATPPRVAAD